MASIETLTRKRELEDAKSPLSKKIKVSDLPLSNTQRSAIDGLVHNFKKNGSFDELRKKAWAKFEESEEKTSFLNALPAIAEAKIDEDPAILSKDRGKATTLVEGAVDRAKVYDIVGSNFRALFNEEYPEALEKVRAMRRKDVGEEQAASEQQRGNKTDEEYSAETRSRLAERRRIREEEEVKQREAERAEARRRRQEEERLQEEAREREAQEKIERDKAREAERERRRKAEQDYDRERAEERERKQRHEREREREWEQEERRRRERDRDWDRGRHKGRDKELAMEDTQASPWRVDDRNDDYASSGAERSDKKLPIVLAPEDEAALAEEAMNLLLREGQEAAAKSRQRPEQDRSESLEPPARRVASSRSSRRDSLAHLRGPLDRKSDSRSRRSPIPTRATSPSFSSHNRVPDARKRYGRSRSASRSRTQTPDDLGRDDRSHYRSSRVADSRNGRTTDRDWRERDFKESERRDRGSLRSRRYSRSRSRPRRTPYPPHSAEAKEEFKLRAVAQREREAEAYKQAQRQQKANDASPALGLPDRGEKQGGTPYTERERLPARLHSPRSRPRSRSRERPMKDRHDRSRSRLISQRRYLDTDYRGERRSPTRDRRSSKFASSKDKNDVELDTYVPRNRRRHGSENRSRSPVRRRDRRSRSRSPVRRREERRRSPPPREDRDGRGTDDRDTRRDRSERQSHVKDIDRYVPSGRHRSEERPRRSDRERSRDRDRKR